MKLTDDQKVQIFCAALAGVAQSRVSEVSSFGKPSIVEQASNLASEAIAKLQSKDWQ